MATDHPLLPAGWPAVTLAEATATLTAPGMPFEMEEVDIRGQKTRVWKNAPPTMRELFVAARAAHADKTFLVYDDERATVESFARAALAFAAALTADGVVKGDRVVISMRNLPEWVATFYGALLVGAIATPLNAWWTGAELEYGLVDSGAKVAIVDADRFERLAGNGATHLQACPALARLWVSRSPAGTALAHPLARRLEDLLGGTNDWPALPEGTLPEVDLVPEDDATIFYTSGTTGSPKGALGTHRGSTCTAFQGAFGALRNVLRRGEPIPEPDPNAPQRATLISVPFFHVTGCMSILNPSLANGGKVVMQRRWDTEQGMALIEREKITSAGGVPTIAWQIVEHPNRSQYDLSSIESIAYGGAPAASELVKRIKEVFPNTAPGIGWGMSETSATFTQHSAEDYVFRPEASGSALPVCDWRIVATDSEGREVDQPVGEIGELWVRGPNVVKGYWNKPEATAKTFKDGWLRTGDVARVDDEGVIYIVDRMKDMIIRGGENIYCIEVENVLYDHPTVMDAALIGIPHRTLGEEPVAVVSFKPEVQGASEDELRGFVAARLAAFKVPVKIKFVDGTLPRNPNGKILKNELKKLFE